MIKELFNSEVQGIILDRDGVINRKATNEAASNYVLDPESLHIFQDFYNFCEWAKERNLLLFVATNQQCLGLGLITEEQLRKIHLKIQGELQSRGLPQIRKFYVCGHVDGTCECRKPKPGLINQIKKDFNLLSNELVFFGDAPSDLSAANNADVQFIQVKREAIQFSDSFIEDFDDFKDLERGK
jgi:D-glycero-D-manno-heptose 1,7-bisphosphate phosphatase